MNKVLDHSKIQSILNPYFKFVTKRMFNKVDNYILKRDILIFECFVRMNSKHER